MVRGDGKPKRRRKKVDARATVGFDPVTYDHLQEIAEAKNAPIAQVVREAVAEYLEDHPKPTARSKRSI